MLQKLHLSELLKYLHAITSAGNGLLETVDVEGIAPVDVSGLTGGGESSGWLRQAAQSPTLSHRR